MLNLYTETAFEAAPPTTASRIEIQIPRANGSYDRSKFSTHQKSRTSNVKDEKGYAQEFLATASAVYFREAKTYPRSFLWRVISNERVLELKCADFARSVADHKEAYLTLALEFQDKVSPRGISFTDQERPNSIHVFVSTKSNEIFEIQLSPDYFRNPSSIPQDVKLWCKPIYASSLSIDTAYKVHATSPGNVFVAFTSGRVQHWRREHGEEQWKQTNFDERTWGSSLLSLVGRKGHPDVDFEGLRLAYNTTHALTASSTHLYTLCLNHTLKIWDLTTGDLVDSRDLLDVAREPQERIQLNPSEPGHIRLLQLHSNTQQILATYSPHQGGQFKFWRIKHGDMEPHNLEDMFPSSTLTPPDPDPTGNTVWSLAGFEVSFDKTTKDWLIWVLWRNHNYHRLYSLNFSFPSLLDSWQQNWVLSVPKVSREKAPDLMISDEQDVTSKWLDYLLFPGRYSLDVLEVALTRYQSLTDGKISPVQRTKSFLERLCSLIASEVSLRKYQGSDMDFDRFAIDTDQQWRNFWRIVESMNEGRYAPLALSYDAYAELPWITMADMYCAVRECSDLEILRYNTPEELEQLDVIARERWPHRKMNGNSQGSETTCCLIRAAKSLLETFSPELTSNLRQIIDQDLYTESEEAIPERIVNIFNELDLANTVSAEAEADFQKNLAMIGETNGVNNNSLDGVFQLFTRSKRKSSESKLIKTVFGSQLTSAAILRETVDIRQILMSLIVLTLFVDESESFEASRYFTDILSRLRIVERNLWLLTHFRRLPLEFKKGIKDTKNQDQAVLDSDNMRTVSILDHLFENTVPPSPAVNIPMTYLITSHTSENLEFISGDHQLASDDAMVRLQCNLIRHGDLNLAVEFYKFQPQTSWSMYAKGRLRLALTEFDEAAIYFRRASYDLAHGKAIGQLQEMSDGLISIMDAENFNSGTPRYFQHIMSLFETAKSFSYVADFARLALQSIGSGDRAPVPQFQQEILSRLFTAEMQCSRFDSAYQALVQFPDQTLQKSSANALVNAMLDPKSSLSNGSGLLRNLQKLPWSIHPHLASQLDSQLTLLAKKQTSLPGQWAISSTVDYLSILHALRLSKKDYRGAVSVLFDRLRIVQRSGRARHDPQATALRHALLALINAMTCVASDEAYILAEAEEDPRLMGVKRNRVLGEATEGPRKKKRIIITLDDLRREYQTVLDRCNRIERGDFDFDVDGIDSEEEEENMQMVHVNGDAMEI